MEPIIPWSGDFSGIDQVPKFFEAIFHSVDVESFDAQEFIAQDDAVVSLGTFGCKVRTTGKSALTRWAFIWRFREGRVCSYEQFHATGLAEAFYG
jgi:ketosteroid isomerase-like protein